MSNDGGVESVYTSRCAGCGTRLGWQLTLGGQWVLVDEDGEPHEAACVEELAWIEERLVRWAKWRRRLLQRLTLT